MIRLYRYNHDRAVINNNINYAAERAISISFVNTGTVKAFVDGIPLLPGDPPLSTASDFPGLDDGMHQIDFAVPDPLDANPVRCVLVFRRKFLGFCEDK